MPNPKDNFWYKLDNAAKIYPATSQRHWNSTFRMSVELDEPVSGDTLRKAVRSLRNRFPMLYVQLRTGVFWYYFEPTWSEQIVSEEHLYPCAPIEMGHSDLPVFRVVFYGCRIAGEFFHAAADGTGALTYLKTLTACYLAMRGYDVEAARWEMADPQGKPVPSEAEDGFERWYQKSRAESRAEPKAYRYRVHPPANEDYIRLISGKMSAAAVHAAAKRRGATVTQYLTAQYIRAFIDCAPHNRLKRPVRISVPVNLRRFFPSDTMRNFSLYVNAGVTPRPDMTLDEILAEIVPQLRNGFQPEALQRAFSANVAAEKNIFLRIAPLFMKNIALRIAFLRFGESRYTSAFSNIGVVTLPECVARHVRGVGFALGCSPTLSLMLAAATFGDTLNLTFTSRSPENSVQAKFFSYLMEEGVEIEVESNE